MRESETRSWMRKIERIFWAGFNIIIPAHCMGCSHIGDTWCEHCSRSLSVPKGLRCPACGMPRLGRECPACSSGLKQLSVNVLAAYKPPLQDALVAFKYRPDRAFADIMAAWLQEKLEELAWEPDFIIPVPLNKVRFRQRGYNQVELITKALARSTTIPHASSILIRVRDTRSQVGLDPNSRFANLERAFKAEAAAVRDRKILLIDDLLTTGATILSCASALADAGARHVYALTIARA